VSDAAPAVLDQAVSPEAILAAATFFARVIHEDIAHRGLTLGRLGGGPGQRSLPRASGRPGGHGRRLGRLGGGLQEALAA
jgi:hypothetical protein